jgi:Icc protein
MHHPPASTCDNPYCGIVNAAETLRVLHQHQCVRAVLSGHLHRAFDNTHDGIRFLGAPSTCRQLIHGGIPHFTPTSAPPAARLIELHGDGAITYQNVSARYAHTLR